MRWPTVILLGVLALVGVVAFVQADKFDFDFHHFYLDGRYVWDHGTLNPDMNGPDPMARRQLPFYPPVVAVLIAPLTALGVRAAAVTWACVHVAALGCSLLVLRRWCGQEPKATRGPWVLVLATLAALPVIVVAARFNQLSFIVLALVLGAVAAVERKAPARAGVLLALATVLKLLPAVFVVWLLLKRQWAALGAFVIAALLIAVVPCLFVFGPRETARHYEDWMRYNRSRGQAQVRGDPSLREHFLDYRNQSIAAVVTRVFSPEHPYAAPAQPLALDRRACLVVSACAAGLLAFGLVFTTRRGRAVLSGWSLRCEGAAYAIAMLVFSPLLRQYYLVWALPALVLLTDAALRPAFGARAGARIAIGAWLLGMLAWAWPTARVYGVHLMMLVVLAALLLGTIAANPTLLAGTSRADAESDA